MIDVLTPTDRLFTGAEVATLDTLLAWNGEFVEVAPDTGLHAVRAEVYAPRIDDEASTMTQGIFSWAATQSRGQSHASGGTDASATDG